MRSDWVDADSLHVVLMTLSAANRLVLEVCLATGLRLSDVLNLRTEQLSTRFTIKELKTGKKRRIFVNNDLLRRMTSSAGKVYVFEGRLDHLKHRTRQAVWHDIKRSATMLRISANVTPHSTRKAWAVSQLEAGRSISDVQATLNHTDLAVTMIYALADKISGNKLVPRKSGKK